MESRPNKISRLSEGRKAKIESQPPLDLSGNTVVLRIKTEYFDQILKKEKTFEYRKFTSFYERTLRNKKYLVLECGPYKGVLTKILGIMITKTPKSLIDVVGSEDCFKIQIKVID